MNEKIRQILEKCNDYYSNGKVYSLKGEEVKCLENELNIILPSVIVNDQLYDFVYYTAKNKWPNDNFFKKLTSNNNGYGVDVEHKFPAGSMTEIKYGEWDHWKIHHKDYLVSEKLDGCSLILTYNCGKLIMAATRGDGIKGKDVLRHILKVANVPHQLACNESVIVRGELVCPKNEISKMLKEIENITGQVQKNGRNTIAGALNRKETNIVVFKYAHFVAYWDSINEGRSFDFLINNLFETPKYEIINNSVSEDQLVEKTTDWINNSKYELDGLILTQYGEGADKGFDTGTINPKQSKKWKISNVCTEKESVVTDIIWQISKAGKYTPVLCIEPIELCGATISRLTASNYENVIKQRCGIGAKIICRRAGAVIPYLEKTLTYSDNFNLPIGSYVNGVDLMCSEDTTNIREIRVKMIEFFAKSLDIDQLGTQNSIILYDDFLNNNKVEMLPEDLLNQTYFTEQKLVDLLGKNGQKLYNSLVEKKNNLTEVKLAAACNSFGIGFGEKILQIVFDKFNTLSVNPSDFNTLSDLEGFGEVRSKAYISNMSRWEEIKQKVYMFGIKLKEVKKVEKISNICVCFSGIRDKEFAKQLQDMGIEVSESFTNKVTHLIVKDVNEETSKIKKAKERKCTILSLVQAKTEMQHFVQSIV